jgi:hypothetical protein
MPVLRPAPEHATETNVTELCASASSSIIAARAGPDFQLRWQRRCAQRGSPLPKWSSGFPSPEAIESPRETIR